MSQAQYYHGTCTMKLSIFFFFFFQYHIWHNADFDTSVIHLQNIILNTQIVNLNFHYYKTTVLFLFYLMIFSDLWLHLMSKGTCLKDAVAVSSMHSTSYSKLI